MGGFKWASWCDAYYKGMYHFRSGTDPVMNICFVDGHVTFTPIVVKTGSAVWEDESYTWFVP